MFRRHNSGKGDGFLGGAGGGGSLPVSTFGYQPYQRNANTSLLRFILDWFERRTNKNYYSRNGIDGSASSIHVPPTIVQNWTRTSLPTKITWISLCTMILMIYIGYRYIRYYNTGIVLVCTSNKCVLRLVHTGYKKPTIVDIGRHQIVRTEPVLVKKDGTFVSGNASIKIDYKVHGKNTKDGLNYKGPDSDGNYLSYAIWFKDKATTTDGTQQQQKHTQVAEEILDQEYDISRLRPVLTVEEDTGYYRLVVREQIPFIAQSKRRVRMMTQKLESYIKKRRMKVTLREISGPVWQGVLLLVIGIIGFILTILLGQFMDDPTTNQHSGPGIRRQLRSSNTNTNNTKTTTTTTATTTSNHHHHHQYRPISNIQEYNKNKVEAIVHEQHIPSQYEVSAFHDTNTTNNTDSSATVLQASGYQQNTTKVISRKRST